jgi:dTDP-4-dehydrorhamnose reductase
MAKDIRENFSEKIGAVVVTRNRRAMVGECVSSLLKLSRLTKIIVIINGSEDDTYSTLSQLKDKRLVLVRLSKNLGSAGGYKEGLRTALKLGLSYAWLFDDDCEPLENSLEELIVAKKVLEKDQVNVAYLSSSLKWLDDGCLPTMIAFDSLSWSKYLADSLLELKWSVFTGLLVNLKLTSLNDLPKKDIFLYSDDIIFTYGLSKKGKGFLVGKSKILHKDYAAKRRTYVSLGKDFKGMKGNALYLRNSIYFARVLFRSGEDRKYGIRMFFGSIKNTLVAALFSSKFYYVPYLLWYFLKGMFFEPKD